MYSCAALLLLMLPCHCHCWCLCSCFCFCCCCAQNLGIYGGCILTVAVLNSCGLRVLTLCTQLGGIFHLVGIPLLVLMVPLMATQRQPASWVFGHFEKAQAEAAGIINPL